MHGREFIQIAARFVTIGAAGSRSATSRAYYGAFHAALELFEEFGCAIPRSGKAHGLVPICLQSFRIEEAKQAGETLGDLHSILIKADYRLDNTEVERVEVGRVAVESASDVARLLDTFRNKCNSDASLRDEFVNEVQKTINRIAP